MIDLSDVTAVPAGELERWLPVPGYEGLYEVSTLGNVWSAPRARTRGGILKPIPDKRGYLYVTLTRNGVQKKTQIHQLVLLAFLHPCPEGMEVRHLDGDAGNDCWKNLVYDTHDINMQDRAIHGTDANANKSHCPKKHEYTPDNTYITRTGSRGCLECKRAKGREQYYRRRDLGLITKPVLTPEEAAERRARQRATENARRARARAQRDLTRACLRCGTVFTPKRSDARFCSRQCRRKGASD